MNIYIYASESPEQAIRLIKCINNTRKNLDNLNIKTINLTDINDKLDIEIGDLLILIVLNSNELNVLINNKDKFINNRVIIVLNENNNELINKAYLLNPRFIEFIDSSYTQLAEIINKISSKCASHSYPHRSFLCAGHYQGGLL